MIKTKHVRSKTRTITICTEFNRTANSLRVGYSIFKKGLVDLSVSKRPSQWNKKIWNKFALENMNNNQITFSYLDYPIYECVMKCAISLVKSDIEKNMKYLDRDLITSLEEVSTKIGEYIPSKLLKQGWPFINKPLV